MANKLTSLLVPMPLHVVEDEDGKLILLLKRILHRV